MLTELESIAEQVSADGRGGRRPGAGRKRKDGKPTKADENQPAPVAEIRSVEELLEHGTPDPLAIPPAELQAGDHGALTFTLLDSPAAFYATAKARKEMALAAKAELEFRIKSKQYLPRESVRSAMAVAFQAVAQSLRSIPDNLERKLGVSPEVAESVSTSIDEAMGDLAYSLEQMHQDHAEDATE